MSNNIDVLVYCSNATTLKTEVEAAFPDNYNEDAKNPLEAISVGVTPALWAGEAFVCRMRICGSTYSTPVEYVEVSIDFDEEGNAIPTPYVPPTLDLLAPLTSLEIFFEGDEDSLSTTDKAKFDSVNDRSPKTFTDEEGKEHIYTPHKIGRFS